MLYFNFKNSFRTIALVICLIALQSFALNAQMRTRPGPINNSEWFRGDSVYQFQVRYPKSQVVSSFSFGMPMDVLFEYIYLDSLMSIVLPAEATGSTFHRWRMENKKNDTLISAIKHLYHLIDYNPIWYLQYMKNPRSYYKGSLEAIHSLAFGFLRSIKLPNTNYYVIQDLLDPDYILRIHVNSVVSLPFKEYPKGNIITYDYVSQVNATVLDTLKGRVFKNCECEQNLNKQKTDNNIQITPNTICFTYTTLFNNFSYRHRKIDVSLFDTNAVLKPNPLMLKPGQDLIVSLIHYNHYYDYNYDYYALSLLTVIPVIDGQVKDNIHEWSDSTFLPYDLWKNTFLLKKDMLLKGGY